jgi:hypothetical protein
LPVFLLHVRLYHSFFHKIRSSPGAQPSESPLCPFHPVFDPRYRLQRLRPGITQSQAPPRSCFLPLTAPILPSCRGSLPLPCAQFLLEGILQIKPVLQLQNHLLRRLLPDPGSLRDMRRVVRQNREPKIISRKRGKNAHRPLRADPGHTDQKPEHLQIIPAEKAVERQSVLFHIQMGE